MPFYDFKCECGHVFEVFKTVEDNDVKKCPVCGSEKTERIMGTFGFTVRNGNSPNRFSNKKGV